MVAVAVILGYESFEHADVAPLNVEAAMMLMGWQRTPAAKKAIAAAEKADRENPKPVARREVR
jgi:hypothetical protein